MKIHFKLFSLILSIIIFKPSNIACSIFEGKTPEIFSIFGGKVPEVIVAKQEHSIWKKHKLQDRELFGYIIPSPVAENSEVLVVFRKDTISKKEVEDAFFDKSKREKVINSACFSFINNPTRLISVAENRRWHNTLESHYNLIDMLLETCRENIKRSPCRITASPDLFSRYELRACVSTIYEKALQEMRRDNTAQPSDQSN